jgi:putative peptidoglycan lipid II flippase
MRHVARSSLIIAVFFGFDKALGLLRQVLTARQFGLTYAIDAFNAANTIPDYLSALISGGALGVAFIPVLSEYLQRRGRPAAWDLFSRILNLAFLVTAGLSVLLALAAQPLVRYVVAPGFPPEQQALTTELFRLDLVAILIFSISGLLMAGLQANQHFLLPALAPAMYNLGQIFGLLVLAPEKGGLPFGPANLPGFGLGIHGLVYGVILGALLHLGIQLPSLLRYGFRWVAAINLRHPGVRQVLVLLGPRVLTMGFLQLFFIASDYLGSSLGEGAITALTYGWFIMQVPETLIGSAIAIALLPTLAERMAQGDSAGFCEAVNGAVRTLLVLTLPTATLLAVCLPPLVSGVFGFDAAGTELVTWVTRAYLLGLAGHALLEVAARSFYARQNALTPLAAAAINASLFFVLAFSLSKSLGPLGIALANCLSFTSEALLLLFLLNRQVPGVLRVGPALLRAAAVAFAGGLFTWGLMLLPLPGLPLALGALALSGLASLPFIFPEVRLLLNL